MKRIKALTKEEQKTLLDAARYAPESRFGSEHMPFICAGKVIVSIN